MRVPIALGWVLSCLAACRPASKCAEAPAAESPPIGSALAPAPAVPLTTIVFVRHAEKASDGTEDPPLTDAGRQRADCLAQMLASSEITHLFTTPYQRTRATLAPLADALGKPAEVIAADAPDRWLEALKTLPPGAHAVVAAHSNTIPALVDALGGEPGKLDDKGNIPSDEYDRMITVVRDSGGEPVDTIQVRYCFDGPSPHP